MIYMVTTYTPLIQRCKQIVGSFFILHYFVFNATLFWTEHLKMWSECIHYWMYERCSIIIKSSLGHRHHMRSHHIVKCTSFTPQSIITFNIIPDHTDARVPSWQELKKIQSPQKTGSCMCIHSQTAISTSSLLWNQWLPKHNFRSPNNNVDGLCTFQVKRQQQLVSNVCCVGLHCCAEGSHLYNTASEGHCSIRTTANEVAEMAVCKWLNGTVRWCQLWQHFYTCAKMG
jgi:hypothetical protein